MDVVATCVLAHEAVLLGLHAAVGAERAVRAVEELAILGIVHQVNPEPFVGGRVDDTFRGIRFGVVRVPHSPI